VGRIANLQLVEHGARVGQRVLTLRPAAQILSTLVNYQERLGVRKPEGLVMTWRWLGGEVDPGESRVGRTGALGKLVRYYQTNPKERTS
jgi:hypothetical protein